MKVSAALDGVKRRPFAMPENQEVGNGNWKKLQKLFGTNNSRKIKQLFLGQLQRNQLDMILNTLDKTDLLQLLRHIPRAMLLKMIKQLPKRVLLLVLLSNYRLSSIMAFMPKQALLIMLMSQSIKMPQLLRSLMLLPARDLKQLVEKLCSKMQGCGKNGKMSNDMKPMDMIKMLKGVSRLELIQALANCSDEGIYRVSMFHARKNPQILFMVPKHQISGIFNRFDHEIMCQTVGVLSEDRLKSFAQGLNMMQLSEGLSHMSNSNFLSHAAQFMEELFKPMNLADAVAA